MKYISIVIPCYNSAKYIKECLDCISKQTSKDFEVVFVDDGSEDETLKILNEFNFDNKLIINSCHLGPAEARNIGVKRATGKYVWFVDSDDIFVNNAVEVIIKYLKESKADVLRFRSNINQDGNITPDQTPFNSGIFEDKTLFTMQRYAVGYANASPFFLWLHVYKKELIENIPFLSLWEYLSESNSFNQRVYPRIKKLHVIDDVLYQYNIRPGSISFVHRPILDKTINLFKALKEDFVSIGIYEQYKDMLTFSIVDCLMLRFLEPNNGAFVSEYNYCSSLDEAHKRIQNIMHSAEFDELINESFKLKYDNNIDVAHNILKVKKEKKLFSFLKAINNYVDLSEIADNLKRNSISKKHIDGKIHIAFIIQYPEMWSSYASVYEELRNDVRFKIDIICFPKRKSIKENDFENENESLAYCKDIGAEAIDGYNNSNIFDIKKLDLDYVIIQRTYPLYLPKGYEINELQEITRIIYISYSGRTEKGLQIDYEYRNLIPYFSLLFADCKEVADYAKARMIKVFSSYQKVYDIGFPKYDLIKRNKMVNNRIQTFLWLPRWKVFEKRNSSHFFVYLDALLTYFKERNDLKLIIRPHPLLFRTCIESGVKTFEEIEKLKQDIAEIENISFDTNYDYQSTFDSVDALIADGTSLLPIFYFSGKPIIMCETDKYDTYIDMFKIMYKTLYVAGNSEELINNINYLVAGRDETKKERNEIINSFYPKDSTVAKKIKEEIFKDYTEGFKNA